MIYLPSDLEINLKMLMGQERLRPQSLLGNLLVEGRALDLVVMVGGSAVYTSTPCDAGTGVTFHLWVRLRKLATA